MSSGLRDAGYVYVNIDDCWMPEEGVYGRNSESGILDRHGAMDETDPAKWNKCKVRCFPTCDPDTGTDAQGKPCEASAHLSFASSTLTCADGGQWIGEKPDCQRAPTQQQSGVQSLRPLVMLQLLALLSAAVLQL